MGGMGEVGGQVFQQHRLILTIWHIVQRHKCASVSECCPTFSQYQEQLTALPCHVLTYLFFVTCWHHNLQRDSCYICSCVPDTCLGCKQSHGAFPIVNWYCVCFSLPTVIVPIKRAKHSRSSAVPRKVIFDWFQLRPGIVITLLLVWKNNKDGKIWRLDVK